MSKYEVLKRNQFLRKTWNRFYSLNHEEQDLKKGRQKRIYDSIRFLAERNFDKESIMSFLKKYADRYSSTITDAMVEYNINRYKTDSKNRIILNFNSVWEEPKNFLLDDVKVLKTSINNLEITKLFKVLLDDKIFSKEIADFTSIYYIDTIN